MNVNIQEYEPATALRSLIQCYWMGDFNLHAQNGLSQSMIPNGYSELIIHLTDNHCNLFKGNTWESSPDYTLLGMFTQPYQVKFNNYVQAFGIRFKPEGLYHVFGIPAAEFGDTFQNIETLAGRRFIDYCHRLRHETDIDSIIHLTDNFLLNHLQINNIHNDIVATAAQLIRKSNGELNIEQLDKLIPISLRQLQRRFKQHMGVSPKTYLRIARINAVHNYLQGEPTADLSDLTYERGFSDQSHFIREFRQMTGDSPKRFLKEREHYIVNPN